MVAAEQRLWSEGEGGASYQPAFHYVDTNQLDSARPVWKCAGDVLVIDDDTAHDLPSDQPRVKVMLAETRISPRADLFVTLGKLLAAKFILPGIRGVGRQPRFHVLGVICVQLPLDDQFGRCVLWHRGLQSFENGLGL